jgi:cyclopropane fatty-acyl-phospholipid synthase-like methyltransferase
MLIFPGVYVPNVHPAHKKGVCCKLFFIIQVIDTLVVEERNPLKVAEVFEAQRDELRADTTRRASRMFTGYYLVFFV